MFLSPSAYNGILPDYEIHGMTASGSSLQGKQQMPIGLRLDVGKVLEAANKGHSRKS